MNLKFALFALVLWCWLLPNIPIQSVCNTAWALCLPYLFVEKLLSIVIGSVSEGILNQLNLRPFKHPLSFRSKTSCTSPTGKSSFFHTCLRFCYLFMVCIFACCQGECFHGQKYLLDSKICLRRKMSLYLATFVEGLFQVTFRVWSNLHWDGWLICAMVKGCFEVS